MPGHSSGLLPLKASRGLEFCGPPPPPGTAFVQLFDDPEGKTLSIVKTIYSELFNLFPDDVFDIGADETHVTGNCTMQNLRGFEASKCSSSRFVFLLV